MRIKIREQPKGGEIDITPMIDVVFLLVIFFMVTTSFIEEAKAYKITIPKVSQAETISRGEMPTLTLSFDDQIFLQIGGEEKAVSDLGEAIKELQAASKHLDMNKGILLRCDARLEYRKYLQAKNAIGIAGWTLIFEEVEIK